jgi:hypothetical protein
VETKVCPKIYVQLIDASVQQAVNSRTAAVLDGWKGSVENMAAAGTQSKASFSDSTKFGEVGRAGA